MKVYGKVESGLKKRRAQGWPFLKTRKQCPCAAGGERALHPWAGEGKCTEIAPRQVLEKNRYEDETNCTRDILTPVSHPTEGINMENHGQ